MKKILILLALNIMLIGCRNDGLPFDDIEGPRFEFYYYRGDEIIFRFNEPVTEGEISYYADGHLKSHRFKNRFPLGDIGVNENFFLTGQLPLEINLVVKDHILNTSHTTLSAPVINKNPAVLIIKEVRLKYSKKRQQMIKLMCIQEGTISGYGIILFIRGKPLICPFLYKEVKKNQIITLFITSQKDIPLKKYKINPDIKSHTFTFPNRLSQSTSAIILINHKNQIMDYLFYYNSKKHDLDSYKENRYYQKAERELIIRGIKPVPFDMAGSTTIKTIIKNRNEYIIRE